METKELKEKIKTELEKYPQGASIDAITNDLINQSDGLFEENLPQKDELKKSIGRILNQEDKKNGLFAKVRNGKRAGKIVYKKGFYKNRKEKQTGRMIINPVEPTPTQLTTQPDVYNRAETTYIGKAGECAVMSELLFRGYNVNTMIVDDGVDVIASKNNAFYFIQVKTTFIRDGKFSVTIKSASMNLANENQMRYIIVARCNVNGVETNLFFILDKKRISESVHNRSMHLGESGNINIKVKMKDGKPYLYNDDREEIFDYYMNRFEL